MAIILKPPSQIEKADTRGVPGHLVEMFDVGRRVHRVPDEISGRGLRDQIEAIADLGPHWWACILRSNGEGMLVPSHTLVQKLSQDRKEFLRDLCVDLNLRLHQGGHWTTVWGIKEFFALWRDSDGHAHVIWSCNEPWERVKKWGGTDFALEQCSEALDQYGEHLYALALKPDQVSKAPPKPPFLN